MLKIKNILLTFIILMLCIGLISCTDADKDKNKDEKSDTPAVSHEYKDIEPFKIKVVNSKTGRGVPLIELRTTNDISYFTDSAGLVAFNEPGLMNEEVYFTIESDGYVFPEGGTTVTVKPGGEATIEVDQKNIAERLYRITGQGIYRDSTLLGIKSPLENPNINGKVMGSDSTQTIIYKNRLYWFWGDTHGPFSVFGNFRVTGATSELPENGGLDPDVGVNLQYFTQNDGFVKQMVPPLPDGAGLCWIGPLMTIKDENGNERLLTGYASLNSLVDLVGRGVLMFNDETEEWDQIADFEFYMDGDWRFPRGGGTFYEENGKEYWVFTGPIPNSRVLNDINEVIDQSKYEAFTPLKPGTEYKGADTEIERDENGKVVWGWKKNTPPIDQRQEADLIKYGLIDPDKDRPHFQFYDVDTGKTVLVHGTTIRWNEYRKKWVIIAQEIAGTSFLGEIWYGESDSITGPWGPLKKIVSHQVFSFYNPIQHEYFQEDNGRVIYFEGTYTDGFTNEPPTPFYNYNQIMYKLELDDPRLGLPFEEQ